MQAPHFTGIMGAPAPNVTITQQGPVPAFNPHEVGLNVWYKCVIITYHYVSYLHIAWNLVLRGQDGPQESDPRNRATNWFLPRKKLMFPAKIVSCQSWARACIYSTLPNLTSRLLKNDNMMILSEIINIEFSFSKFRFHHFFTCCLKKKILRIIKWSCSKNKAWFNMTL